MHTKILFALFAGALMIGASAMLAAPEQGTITPGQMTQAKVWVQNRGGAEAVPVDLREINLSTPIRVQVINGDPAHGANTAPVPVRVIRPQWEYQSVIVKAGQDPATWLAGPGASGWETTGITVNRADDVLVLMKRMR